MARSDYEESIDRGQPVDLYQFIYGEAGTSIYYTDGETEVVYNGQTYIPHPISRDTIESNGSPVGKEVKLRTARNSEVADLFLIYPPGSPVSVIIRSGHVPNSDDPVGWAAGENFPVVWTGRVLEVSRSDNTALLNCESASAGMRRPGLRRHYQWPCPLALYGSRCGATKVPINVPVVSTTGNKIVFASGFMGARVASNFIGGLVEWTGEDGKESRGILRVEGATTVVVSGVIRGLSPAEVVSVLIGCPRTLAGCETLHNNVVRYGGHPWIPSDGNPIGKNNHT